MKVRNYQELIAWRRAMDLVELIYKASSSFPREVLYALTTQIRRAVVSIPSDIAQGQGRRTTLDFLRHLFIAYGSLREVETQLLISLRLKYLTAAQVEGIMQKAGEVGRLVNGLMNSLSRT